MPYTIEIRHDGIAYNIAIPELVVPQCRSCGELLFDNQADSQVDDAVRAELKLLVPSQIRQGRMQLGLNQADLAKRIGASEGTISRWETGALIQSRTSDHLLRLFFDLSQVREALERLQLHPNIGPLDAPPSGQDSQAPSSGR